MNVNELIEKLSRARFGNVDFGKLPVVFVFTEAAPNGAVTYLETPVTLGVGAITVGTIDEQHQLVNSDSHNPCVVLGVSERSLNHILDIIPEGGKS